jgi:hypothetical protein
MNTKPFTEDWIYYRDSNILLSLPQMELPQLTFILGTLGMYWRSAQRQQQYLPSGPRKLPFVEKRGGNAKVEGESAYIGGSTGAKSVCREGNGAIKKPPMYLHPHDKSQRLLSEIFFPYPQELSGRSLNVS